MYDGSEHSVSGYTVDTAGATFEDITVGAVGTDADTYLAEFADDVVGKIDTTAKYIVADAIDGELEITKRNVTLTSATDSKPYDGTPLTKDEVIVSDDGFAAGEGAEYNVTGSQTYVGTSDNYFTYTLNEGTKAQNYNITTVLGKLSVTNRDDAAKFEITVEANSAEYKYDGSAKSVSGLKTTEFEIGGVVFTVE